MWGVVGTNYKRISCHFLQGRKRSRHFPWDRISPVNLVPAMGVGVHRQRRSCMEWSPPTPSSLQPVTEGRRKSLPTLTYSLLSRKGYRRERMADCTSQSEKVHGDNFRVSRSQGVEQFIWECREECLFGDLLRYPFIRRYDGS